VRLASFTSHLLLDGHGPTVHASPRRRDLHPYFGTAPYNVGDQFVALAIARVLEFEEFYSIDPEAPDEDFETINRECDVFLIRGSNFIYPGFFAQNLHMDLLRKIEIPIVYLGAGLQCDLDQRIELLEEDVESLKYIHASSASCSVRGYRSAELMHAAGIDNVRVTGCPSIFWTLQPTVKVRPPAWDHVGWTVTDMSWRPDLNRQQFALMDALRERAARLHVVVQGGEVVLQEYILCRDGLAVETRCDTQVSPALLKSRRERKSLDHLAAMVGYYYRDAPKGLLEPLLNRSFFSNSVFDYFRYLRGLTLVYGTRLHGNVMALCQGTPTFFVLHDSRLEDMAELMRVPCMRIDDPPDALEVDASAWLGFERVYPEIYRTFRDFLEENGLKHNLQGGAAA